jgi:hypothetical protein
VEKEVGLGIGTQSLGIGTQRIVRNLNGRSFSGDGG